MSIRRFPLFGCGTTHGRLIVLVTGCLPLAACGESGAKGDQPALPRSPVSTRYDLRADPFELHDLGGVLPLTRLATLHRQLRRLASCHGAP